MDKYGYNVMFFIQDEDNVYMIDIYIFNTDDMEAWAHLAAKSVGVPI